MSRLPGRRESLLLETLSLWFLPALKVPQLDGRCWIEDDIGFERGSERSDVQRLKCGVELGGIGS